MPTARFSIRESSVRLFFGLLLWGVSATLTLVLLISLGDGTVFSKVLLGVIAIALEGAKILSWRKGGAYRVYAVTLIILSGIASLGASLQVVEKTKGALGLIVRENLQSSQAFSAKAAELKSIDSEIETLLLRIRTLPPDYSTATARLETSLTSLRDRKAALIASISEAEKASGDSHDSGSMVGLLGKVLGLREDLLLLVLLVLLLFVSAAIEVGALILTAPERGSRQEEQILYYSEERQSAGRLSKQRGRRNAIASASPVTPEAFLEAAMEGAKLPYIHGRDRTAEKLGISYAEAKRLVGKLIADGKIVADGKRLRIINHHGIKSL
jgi:hypothetical protein